MSPLEPNTVKLYLLGQLDQTKLAQIEEHLLTSATLYDEILLAEDELTDKYIANELSEEDRRSFETHFLSTPERRQKLRFARVLLRYLDRESEASLPQADQIRMVPDNRSVSPLKAKYKFPFLPIQNPIAAYGLAAVVLVGLIGASWMLWSMLRPATSHSGKVLVATLTPGLVRGEGDQRTNVVIPADVESVQLNLELKADEYPSYRAELLTSDAGSLTLQEDLKSESVAGRKIINFTVPAKLLRRNDYRVRLSGRTAAGSYEPLSSYTFRVTDNR